MCHNEASKKLHASLIRLFCHTIALYEICADIGKMFLSSYVSFYLMNTLLTPIAAQQQKSPPKSQIGTHYHRVATRGALL